MRILVTGGAGFIGSHLCDRLLHEKHDVIVVDNLITGSLDNIAHLDDRILSTNKDVAKHIIRTDFDRSRTQAHETISFKYITPTGDIDIVPFNFCRIIPGAFDVIVIDEIGSMELFSTEFRKAVGLAVRSNKPVIGTIHSTARDQLINDIKSREDAEILSVTRENRESIDNTIVYKVIQLFKRS